MTDIYLKKITVYSILEMIFTIALIFLGFVYFVGVQNDEFIINNILNIILIILLIIILTLIGLRKFILKRKRYKYLLSLDDHII